MRERISGVDTAWLRMEHPTNQMTIVGVMMLEGKVRTRDVKRLGIRASGEPSSSSSWRRR